MNKNIILGGIVLLLVIGNIVYLYPKYQVYTNAPLFEATPEITALADEGQTVVQDGLTNHIIAPENFKTEPLPGDVAAFVTLFKKAQSDTLFRVKIWNNDYRVIWSNAPELIGNRFPTNAEVAKIFTGSSHVVEGKLNSLGGSNDTNSEGAYNNYVELYFPVKDSAGKIVGIVELYYTVENVVQQYKNAFYTSMAVLTGGSLVLLGMAWFLLRKRDPHISTA